MDLIKYNKTNTSYSANKYLYVKRIECVKIKYSKIALFENEKARHCPLPPPGKKSVRQVTM